MLQSRLLLGSKLFGDTQTEHVRLPQCIVVAAKPTKHQEGATAFSVQRHDKQRAKNKSEMRNTGRLHRNSRCPSIAQQKRGNDLENDP